MKYVNGFKYCYVAVTIQFNISVETGIVWDISVYIRKYTSFTHLYVNSFLFGLIFVKKNKPKSYKEVFMRGRV